MGKNTRREKAAEARGLSKDSTWEKITTHDRTTYREKLRMAYILERGLPQDATWAAIQRYDESEDRMFEARRRGLPKSASWENIQKHDREQREIIFDQKRIERCRELGLPATTSQTDLWSIEEKIRHKEMCQKFGLPEDTPYYMVERYRYREYLAQKWDIDASLLDPMRKIYRKEEIDKLKAQQAKSSSPSR